VRPLAIVDAEPGIGEPLEFRGKATVLMHSLALNHPFVDGNKRVAAFAAIGGVAPASPVMAGDDARYTAASVGRKRFRLMPDCPNCGWHLNRVHRSPLEKLAWADAYTCSKCHSRYRVHSARIAAFFDFA
jgi:hypothetical protein